MEEIKRNEHGRIIFTEKMKSEYKILFPDMLPIHFDLIGKSLELDGFDIEILKNDNFQQVAGVGTKYIHNDMCVPAILVIGQMIEAIQSGKYDINKVALAITQTGGGCRASNYIHLLRKGLDNAGLGHVPVVSLSLSGLEDNPGFKPSVRTYRQMVISMILGDMIMWCANAQRPYEVNKGETDQLIADITEELLVKYQTRKFMSVFRRQAKKEIYNIAHRFANIETDKTVKKPKVGVVGEIYVKFAPLGNNNLEQFLRDEDCEVVVPGLTDFIIFKVDNRMEDAKLYGGASFKKKFLLQKALNYFMKYQNVMIDACKSTLGEIEPMGDYKHLKSLVKDYVGYGNKMGEGWLLTAEMLELIQSGVPNIVCTQPFGCLPNHIIGRGMFKPIKDNHPEANIIPIDYDPGATKVNQENRIKLMLSNAKKDIKKSAI